MQCKLSIISDSLKTVCWLTAHLLTAALTAAHVVTHGREKYLHSAGLCSAHQIPQGTTHLHTQQANE